MEMTLTTPSLVFPAITLLLLAYTNRFLATASLVRNLHANYRTDHSPDLEGQILNLRKRLVLIKYTQTFGIASLLLSVVSVFFLFAKLQYAGIVAFVACLILMMVSLCISLYEAHISIVALNLELSDIKKR